MSIDEKLEKGIMLAETNDEAELSVLSHASESGTGKEFNEAVPEELDLTHREQDESSADPLGT